MRAPLLLFLAQDIAEDAALLVLIPVAGRSATHTECRRGTNIVAVTCECGCVHSCARQRAAILEHGDVLEALSRASNPGCAAHTLPARIRSARRFMQPSQVVVVRRFDDDFVRAHRCACGRKCLPGAVQLHLRSGRADEMRHARAPGDAPFGRQLQQHGTSATIAWGTADRPVGDGSCPQAGPRAPNLRDGVLTQFHGLIPETSGRGRSSSLSIAAQDGGAYARTL